MKKGEINHDTGENVKKDVRDMITQRVQFPEMIIDGITKYPDGLVSIPLFKREYLFDSFPI
jgi:hypothetical protein